MFTVHLIEVQRLPTIVWRRRTKAVRVLRIAAGVATCSTLLGCVTDAGQAVDPPSVVSSSSGVALDGAAIASAKSTGDPVSEDAGVMLAKARALAFADPIAKQSEPQIDLAMIAMRSNPGATYRLDGSASPEAKSTLLAPDVVMDRLRSLSHAPRAARPDADQSDRTQAVLERLKELSQHPKSDKVREEQQAAPQPRESTHGPNISPEAMLRRMRELSAEKPAAEDAIGKPGAPPVSAQDVFGGLAAFVPAPDPVSPSVVARDNGKATMAGQ